ncbi:MAG: DUF4352 domain-containing protein [Leuconostoc pseudomesenteroides]
MKGRHKQKYNKKHQIFTIGIFLIITFIYVIYHFNTNDSVKKVVKTQSKSFLTSQSTVKVGETAVYKNIHFRVNNFDFKDSNAIRGDSITHKLGIDSQLVVVNITITNLSKQKFDYDAYFFQLDDNGKLTDTTEAYPNVDHDIDSGTLGVGDSITGNLVAKGNTNHHLKIIYQQDINPTKGKITFKLN